MVAMANKLARIAWGVLSSGNKYRPGRNLTVLVYFDSLFLFASRESERTYVLVPGLI